MTADRAAFRAQFPTAFPNATDADIDGALAEAELLHSIRELATLYCAAHLLALDTENFDALDNRIDKPDGGSGIVTAETIGPRRIEYLSVAGASERDAFFASTTYGRRFLALERRSPRASIGAVVV